MEGFKELFSQYLTEETPKTNAIFTKDKGSCLWHEIRLDMILKVYDEAMEIYKTKKTRI